MIEDDVYRASSQYRYWSYTKESLARIRQNTNDLASERVKAAFQRVHAAKTAINRANDEGNGTQNGGDDPNVQTLTVEEELKVVEWGCSKITDMGEAMNPRIPSHIMATAIQYLRRFYLTNSVMTYNPKQIIACALYLATKADHFYISLSKFVAELEGVTEDNVKAPEFLLLQGLRFTLDVRHPMKGLAGGHIDMNVMAEEGQLRTISTSSGSAKRIGVAADHAKRLLATAAQMTDAYFLYTPSQIWLAAMMVADRELMEIYLDHKMSDLPSNEVLKNKLVSTLSGCATLLESWRSPEDDATQRKEIRRIGKKLTVCQNPEKTDIVAVAKAKAAEKREGDGSDAEKALKKRKLEREKLEKDGDVFGPSLKDLPA